MTQRRGKSGPPCDLVAEGAQWPDAAALDDLSAPLRNAVHFAADLSSRLDAALEGRSIASVAREADVARSTLYDLKAGATWPDLVSVFKLESALGVALWVRPGT